MRLGGGEGGGGEDACGRVGAKHLILGGGSWRAR